MGGEQCWEGDDEDEGIEYDSDNNNYSNINMDNMRWEDREEEQKKDYHYEYQIFHKKITEDNIKQILIKLIRQDKTDIHHQRNLQWQQVMKIYYLNIED